MRDRSTSILAAALLFALAAAGLTAVAAGPAGATPSRNTTCTSCHSGAASGAVTAVPSSATPSPGATYAVNVSIGLTASGQTGYHVAQTDAAGTATTWMAVSGGPSAQTSWAPKMTAPATPGTYYYKVWTAKGPDNSSGMAKAATYSITVPAPAAPPALTGLVPSTGIAGSLFTITGASLGTSGTVTVGGLTAATSAWSATSITCTVPATSTVGAKSVVVTPAGASATNALTYTVTAAPAPAPAIAAVSPTHAETGATVVITGTDFGATGVVEFGSVAATTTAWSATSVTATVPAGLAPGATTVTVTPGGGPASNAAAFTVDAPQEPVDATAPATTATGVPAAPWCNHAVTVQLDATDEPGGSGVASVTYAVDGGSPVPVAGAAASVPLETSGAHTVSFFATDAAGNTEAVRSVSVNIDMAKPQPQAPRAAKVRQKRTAVLRYRVVDEAPNGGTADVVIVVRDKRGRTVKRLVLPDRAVNAPLTARFACTLSLGTYRFRVSATDAAGNPQTTVATQKLWVLARR